MDGTATALLGRVSVNMPDAAIGRLELHLDGWPLILVDADGGAVRVNDLRTSALFAHHARLPCEDIRLAVRTGAVGDELYVLLGELAAVFVTLDTARPTHAEVRVIEAATGRLLLDRSIRYRQLPAEPGVFSDCIRPWE
ncbi:MAG: hypothetical protein WD830_11810 [Chloroflexota bacterium]